MGETRTELRLTDLHSDLTIERHKGTREIIHSIPEIICTIKREQIA